MSDPRPQDPNENGLDKGTGDPNDDRAYLQDLPPAQVQGDDRDSDNNSENGSDSLEAGDVDVAAADVVDT